MVDTGVTVYSVIPPNTKTELRRALPVSQSAWGAYTVKPMMDAFFRTPEEAAQTILYCALDPKVANETGKIYRLVIFSLSYSDCNF